MFESFYKAIFETSLDGLLVVDTTGTIVEVNRAYSDMAGYDMGELEGAPITQIDADENALNVQERLNFIRTTKSAIFTVRHRRKDGSVFPVKVHCTYVDKLDFFVSFIRDITTDHQVTALIEAIPDLIFINDLNGVYLDAHADPSQLYVGKENFIGKTIEETLPPQVAARVRVAMEEAVKSREVQTITYYLTVDSVERFFDARISMYGEDKVLSVVRDITALKTAQEDLLEAQVQLHHSQKMEAIGLLAGGVAHDMNNVLTAIMGLTGAHLAASPEGCSFHKSLGTITTACERGASLVKKLVDFARKAPLKEAPVDLNKVITDVAELLARTTLSKINLKLDLEPSLGPVLGDESAISHIIMNLCVNSVDAMETGGTLKISTKNIEDQQVQVEVEDTGSGIPTELLNRVTDPFFTTKEEGKGTGLGLSLAQSSMRAHGGYMQIFSELGVGTTIKLVFPVTATVGATTTKPEVVKHQLFTVLVVDDDPLVIASSMGLLELIGHTVYTVESGEEALKLLKTHHDIDVVLLDVNMPGLGGIRTLPKIRDMRPILPVILSSGKADEAVEQALHTFKYVWRLDKPYGLPELTSVLQKIEHKG